MADIPSVSPEAVTSAVQPQSPEIPSAGLERGFTARAEALFGDPQARILAPSYKMQSAEVSHTDPTKHLIATHDATSHTSFLVESYPIEGSAEDRYEYIRWERTNPQEAETGIPNGCIRIEHRKGREPRIALATSRGSAHEALLPGGEYAEGFAYVNEATDLSPEVLQVVLSRLNHSTVDAELTEKMWQYAEKDRLNWHVGNANYLASVTYNTGNTKQSRQIAAYRNAVEKQYRDFMTQYHFPQEATHDEPTQAEIDSAVASYRALVTAHPEIIEYARRRDEAALDSWLKKNSAGGSKGMSSEQTNPRKKYEEEEKKKKAEQAAIEAIKEELELTASTTS